jgi:hypothetical protein
MFSSGGRIRRVGSATDARWRIQPPEPSRNLLVDELPALELAIAVVRCCVLGGGWLFLADAMCFSRA